MQCAHCKRLDLDVLFATEEHLAVCLESRPDYRWHGPARTLVFAWYENIREIKASAGGNCEMCKFVFEIVVRSRPLAETLAGELSVVMYAGNGATVEVGLDDPKEGLITLCTLDLSAESKRRFFGLYISPWVLTIRQIQMIFLAYHLHRTESFDPLQQMHHVPV